MFARLLDTIIPARRRHQRRVRQRLGVYVGPALTTPPAIR
jgi:hypothetical protein